MDFQIHEDKVNEDKMGFFPYDQGKVKGVMIYMNCHPDLSVHLSKVEAARGKIIIPKKQISPQIGYYATKLDTEGNRIALHSQN